MILPSTAKKCREIHVFKYTFIQLFVCKICKNWNWHCICFCLHFILSFAKRIKSFQSIKRFLFSKSGGFCAKLAIISLQRSKSKHTSNYVFSQFSSNSEINEYSFWFFIAPETFRSDNLEESNQCVWCKDLSKDQIK